MVNSIKSNCDCLLGKEVHVNDRPESVVHVMSQKTSKFPSHWNETFCIRTRMEEIKFNCVLTGRSNQTEVGRSSVVILKSLPSCIYNFRQFLIYSTFVLLQKHMLYLRGPLH